MSLDKVIRLGLCRGLCYYLGILDVLYRQCPVLPTSIACPVREDFYLDHLKPEL